MRISKYSTEVTSSPPSERSQRTKKSLAPLSCVLREARLFVVLDEGLLQHLIKESVIHEEGDGDVVEV